MKNLKPVFPSKEVTIKVDEENDDYGGAHKYHLTNSLGHG